VTNLLLHAISFAMMAANLLHSMWILESASEITMHVEHISQKMNWEDHFIWKNQHWLGK